MRWLVPLLAGLAACGGPDVYAACEGPADCDVPAEAEAVCLDKSGEGFCSWECSVDADCDYASEEEEARWARVCASFEDEAGTFCFPSCDEGADEEDEVCPGGFTCRSTGGGADNRKVCFPEG
jgi:hypothetical protein